MKVHFPYTFLLIVICAGGPSSLASPLTDKQIPDLQEFEGWDNFTGNQYFQATQQIFYINSKNDCQKNETENEKENPKIPDDYVITPKIGAHKFHSTPKSWNEARSICISEGAHLAVIRSAEEEAVIKKLHLDSKIWQGWLGVHGLFANKNYVTVFDEPLDKVGYAPWNKGEPNHPTGINVCIGYIKETWGMGLNDEVCSMALPFYCKIDLK